MNEERFCLGFHQRSNCRGRFDTTVLNVVVEVIF